MNDVALLYLPMEETGILHGAVRLIELLVGVAHVFVPEARLLLRRDLEQRPHLLLYRVCIKKQKVPFWFLFFYNTRQTDGLVHAIPHRWCQLY